MIITYNNNYYPTHFFDKVRIVFLFYKVSLEKLEYIKTNNFFKQLNQHHPVAKLPLPSLISASVASGLSSGIIS